MNKHFTYEHCEGRDEYIVLHRGPIGYTVSKHDAIVITNWLNSAYNDIVNRIQTPSTEEYKLSGGE